MVAQELGRCVEGEVLWERCGGEEFRCLCCVVGYLDGMSFTVEKDIQMRLIAVTALS